MYSLKKEYQSYNRQPFWTVSIFTVLLLLVASLSFGQVHIQAGTNYGLRLDNANSTFNYQAGFTVIPSYGLMYNKLKVGLRGDSYISNTLALPQVFTGLNVSYAVYKISFDGNGETPYASDNGQHNLILGGHWLYGSGGYQLIGGTASYSIDCDWNVDVDMSQEYKTKQFYGSVGVSYLLF